MGGCISAELSTAGCPLDAPPPADAALRVGPESPGAATPGVPQHFQLLSSLAALNPGTGFDKSKNYCNILETVVCSGMFAGQYLSNITVIIPDVNGTFKGSGVNLTYMDWFKYQRTAL